MLVTIMKNLQFLGRHGLALRGHNESESNFIQLLKLRGHDQNVYSILLANEGGWFISDCAKKHFSVKKR